MKSPLHISSRTVSLGLWYYIYSVCDLLEEKSSENLRIYEEKSQKCIRDVNSEITTKIYIWWLLLMLWTTMMSGRRSSSTKKHRQNVSQWHWKLSEYNSVKQSESHFNVVCCCVNDYDDNRKQQEREKKKVQSLCLNFQMVHCFFFVRLTLLKCAEFLLKCFAVWGCENCTSDNQNRRLSRVRGGDVL